MKSACVCVFSKAPEQGKVKTRLLPVLTPQQACQVHENLLQHCVFTTQDSRWQSQLWTTDIKNEFIKRLSKKYSMTLHPQLGSELGKRMFNAVKFSLETFSYVVVIGTDCPSLDAKYIAEAIAQLKLGADVVLGPAEDGGYVLIAMSQQLEYLFRDMQWGSDRVLEETRNRLQDKGLHWHELETRRDIDRPNDLDYLKQHYPALTIR